MTLWSSPLSDISSTIDLAPKPIGDLSAAVASVVGGPDLLLLLFEEEELRFSTDFFFFFDGERWRVVAVGFGVDGVSGDCDCPVTIGAAWPRCFLCFLGGVVGSVVVTRVVDALLCVREETLRFGDEFPFAGFDWLSLLLATAGPPECGGGDKGGAARRIKSSSVRREGGGDTGVPITFQTIWSSSEDKTSETGS
jgi:hypothetical protein